MFTNDEINTFYLSTLNMKNTLESPLSADASGAKVFSNGVNAHSAEGLSSNFYLFLSVLFDIAANKSYYDTQYGVFGTMLSN